MKLFAYISRAGDRIGSCRHEFERAIVATRRENAVENDSPTFPVYFLWHLQEQLARGQWWQAEKAESRLATTPV